MRISDWSSDVCSSDLIHIAILPETLRNIAGVFSGWLSNTLDVPKATSLISRPSLIVRVGERRADLQDLTWRTHRVLLSSNLFLTAEIFKPSGADATISVRIGADPALPTDLNLSPQTPTVRT